jgi:ribonuclease BN (tRNA processing enzyme)
VTRGYLLRHIARWNSQDLNGCQISRLRLDLTQLDTVLLTHLHMTTAPIISAVILAGRLTSDTPITFKIFGPNGGLSPFFFDQGGAFEYEKTFGVAERISGVDLNGDHKLLETTIVDANGFRIINRTPPPPQFTA